MDFLKELNKNQYDAVTYIDGPSLVIAGAGSGKTRVLTYKIAYLLSSGFSPMSILALTFTNKAAREMKHRIGELVGAESARYLWMGTFHSIFSKILRSEAELIGYSKDFTINDTTDSKNLIKSIVKELGLDSKTYKPATVYSRISFAKNNLMTAREYFVSSDMAKSDQYFNVPKVNEIYAIYDKRCRASNVMDFDDLLLNTYLLLVNNSDVLSKYQEIFKYILVDEYQDTNYAQYLIVKMLAEKSKKICVVGDDAQSIYSFRGADISNILNFQNTYSHAKLFKLEQNYRSTQTIVNAANSLITKNNNQIKKSVFSENSRGDLIKLMSLFTDIEEATVVSKQIAHLRTNIGVSYNDIAVLYRTNSQSRVMEESLRRQGVPYKIYGGLSFYQRKEIKDVVAYLRMACNPNDGEALKRIINYPARGIGEVTIKKISTKAEEYNIGMWDVICDTTKYCVDINAGTATKISKFKNLMLEFVDKANNTDAYELGAEIVKKTGIISEAMVDKSIENISIIDNVHELLKHIYEYSETKRKEEIIELVTMSDFLSEISLLTDQDTDSEDDTEKITMMTIHAAKGLEYKNVFVVGLEEQLFPSAFADSPKAIEEERRLFYVAITRAKERCFISYAKSRFRNGTVSFVNPSRFLNDINSKYLDIDDEFGSSAFMGGSSSAREFKKEPSEDILRNGFRSSSPNSSLNRNSINPNLKRIDTGTKVVIDDKDYPKGSFVKHFMFGIGKVLETNSSSGNEQIVIDFGEKGKKTLLKKFAKLEKLE